MLGLHQRRLNELIAKEYTGELDCGSALAVMRKYRKSHAGHLVSAANIIQTNMRGFKNDNAFMGDRAEEVIERMDKFVSGAGSKIGEGGRQIAVDPQVADLADQLVNQEEKQITGHVFEDIPPEQIESTVANTADLVKWSKKCLAEWNLLSSDPDYDPGRSGSAEDEKWQVSIDPSMSSAREESRQKALLYPDNFNRTISQVVPAGGAPLVVHELAHTVQVENRGRVGLAITREVGTDRASIVNEAGAVAWETARSEERRVGKECRSRWSPDH